MNLVLALTADSAPSVVENVQTNPNFWRAVHYFSWSNYVPSQVGGNITTSADGFSSGPPIVTESMRVWPRGTVVSATGNGQFSFFASFFNSPYQAFVLRGTPTFVSTASGGEGQNFYDLQQLAV